MALAQPQRPPEPGSPQPVRGGDSGVGGIEIVLPNGARVSVDAFVNEKALASPPLALIVSTHQRG
jgi:hypothetical protein